jgi:hypothetical protein
MRRCVCTCVTIVRVTYVFWQLSSYPQGKMLQIINEGLRTYLLGKRQDVRDLSTGIC